MTFGQRTLTTESLDGHRLDQVLPLLAAATEADGVAPISEHTELRLRRGYDADGVHLLVVEDDRLVGYAGLDLGQQAGAELVVHPQHRRRGIGTALLSEVVSRAAAGPGTAGGRAGQTGVSLRIWAHGDLPGAAALARSTGFTRARVLLQMQRDLSEHFPPKLPPGVVLRTFRPGQDEQAWLDLNAAAFANHPDQAKWTMEDLRARLAQPWFDPAGFLLAEREGTLVGFHWTKVHEGRVGEIYVLGVAPAAHGTGLGGALVAAGLAHLRSAGLSRVMLYVDEDNTAAVRLYTTFGFRTFRSDVSYHRRINEGPR